MGRFRDAASAVRNAGIEGAEAGRDAQALLAKADESLEQVLKLFEDIEENGIELTIDLPVLGERKIKITAIK